MNIGMMQGRLLPPIEGRFQAFPAGEWQKEFYLGQKINLHCIEWIYEKPNEEKNPITTLQGIQEIQSVVKETHVQVRSICADYFMTERLVIEGEIQRANVEHLKWLLSQAQRLGVTYIVLPFVDQSSLSKEPSLEPLFSVLKEVLPIAVQYQVELHLETDLKPQVLKSIFETIQHPFLKLNYDIGNSASLGFHPNDELSAVGEHLGSVHVKDRIYQGSTVMLGTGNADLPACFDWFKKLNFNRWYVLQVARGTHGDELQHIANIKTHVQQLWSA